MDYDFDRPVDRTGTGSVKFDGLKEYFGSSDLIPMWVADMDFQVPGSVIKAIKERADHGIFGYTLITPSFYNAIINWMQVRHDWEVSANWVLFSPGIVPALTMSVIALTEIGDKILLQSPVYPPFYHSIQGSERLLVNNQLTQVNGAYSIDYEDLEQKLSQGVKMMLFCNPHNPVGRVWTRHEIEEVVSLCRKYKVILVSDEIHSDLIYPDHRHIPAAVNKYGTDNLIICMAPSKTFNLAGLASAFLIIPDVGLRRKMKRLIENFHLHYGNLFGLVALQAAYEGGGAWLDALIGYLQANRDTLVEFFRKEIPEINPIIPQGTYLVWLDCKKTGMNDRELKKFFVKGAGIATNPGPSFGPGGEGFHRINIGCRRAVLLESLIKIKHAWQQR